MRFFCRHRMNAGTPTRRVLLLTLVMASVCQSSTALAIDADVKGVRGELATNIRNYLQSLNIPENADTQSYSAEVTQRVQDALKPFGYYEPDIAVSFQNREQVTVDVDHGAPVRVRSVVVRVEGAAEDDEPFQQALQASPLTGMEGERLLHTPYDTLKSRLTALALERGYFDARYRQSRIEVHPWEHAAYISLIFESGERYRFGDIFVTGSQIREERLRKMAPFDPNDRYLATDVARYSQRLGDSGWFRSISVRPRLDERARKSASPMVTSSPDVSVEGPDGKRQNFQDDIDAQERPQQATVPIDINVTPEDRHKFETGIGYSTDVGPRINFGWNMPWLNDRGDSLNNDLVLSGPEQTLTGEYNVPLANPARDNYYMRYGFKNTDRTESDTRSFESSVAFGREWRFENDWIQNAYLRTTYEDFTQGDEEDKVLLFIPGMSWSRTRTDNTRFPMWGDRQDILVEGSNNAWGSDANFLRTRLDSQWIRSLGENNRFVGRATVGATSTDDFSQVPPSLRFFTGGDSSVRGYEYETIAPENSDGDLLGGKHLLVGSLEYQRQVAKNWWGATFVDAGNAFSEWWPDELKTSAGVGVRWISPVGPVRLDIAHPFDSEEDSWRLHFGIGPEF
ncbi:autotransporter assembly complex protein TamA [Kushneria sp. Sum13]|uniref:autotransporter assembly complex protein TamA n=1 Tax=Kushneria sp. Sum13 TaxID=3459196 RepID=UPI004045ABC2